MSREIERSAPRLKTFERTTIVHDGATVTAHVLNVSETGAQVHSSARIAPGHDVRVSIAGTEVRGSVVWADSGRFGVRFSRKLATDEIDALLR